MTEPVDHDGIPLFVDDFIHSTHDANGATIDVIKTTGNLWFSGPAVMEAMGFQQDGAGGGYSRRLSRIKHPDIIKITETPFRFTDGRRNRGSLISPRAVHDFADKKVKGFNAIKSYAFLQWMTETLLSDGDENSWSPKRPAPIGLEPVFHKVTRVKDQNEHGEDLDPLRPSGEYHGLNHFGPLRIDEVVFAMDQVSFQQPKSIYDIEDGILIDEEDDFTRLTAWPKAA
ncbi:hypothetical protein [Pseudophaeobacter sp.]|uniref:hypothetical protein n=1 Tax=Pseudophaeobacter sp. TaxID=1971739 RepID=UPI00329A0BB9